MKQNNREIWKPVLGFQKFYLVSNYGNVYSLLSKMNIKPYIGKSGYSYIQVYNKTGKYKTYKIHRMVYEAFVRPLDKNEDVNHLDMNRANNHLSNLVAMNHADHIKMHKVGHVTSEETKRKISISRKRAWRAFKRKQKIMQS